MLQSNVGGKEVFFKKNSCAASLMEAPPIFNEKTKTLINYDEKYKSKLSAA